MCPVIAPQIDFVAHDDIPYSSAGSEDVYKHIKEAGQCGMAGRGFAFPAKIHLKLCVDCVRDSVVYRVVTRAAFR